MKLREHLLAYAMVAVLFLLLWQIAAWVEVRRHTPRLRTLALTESMEVVSFRPPETVQGRIENSPSVQRRIPRMPESLQVESTILNPEPQTLSSTTHLKQTHVELYARAGTIETSSVAVETRTHSHALRLLPTKPEPSSAVIDVHRNTMEVVKRPESPHASLEIPDRIPESQVLKMAEAKKIIQWMRITESDLPPGIRNHVGYEPGNLSSSAHLEYKGETWEIYLMARMPSEELHVVIVRGDATYYVVDPSFRRDGRRFRVGTAHRRSGEITGIISEERAASSADAGLHYDVFLAWWDEMRLTLP